MSSILPKLLSWLLVYRYAALFSITFLGSLGIPLPAAPSTMAASAFAGQGYLNLFWVMLWGSAGNIFGDITMYWLARRWGKNALKRLGLKKLADSQAAKNAEETAKTYKAAVVIASRFQVQATALINIISGMGKMNFRHFTILVITGEVLQMGFYVSIGYFFADAWQTVYSAIGKFSWIIAVGLAIFFTVLSGKIFKNPKRL